MSKLQVGQRVVVREARTMTGFKPCDDWSGVATVREVMPPNADRPFVEVEVETEHGEVWYFCADRCSPVGAA